MDIKKLLIFAMLSIAMFSLVSATTITTLNNSLSSESLPYDDQVIFQKWGSPVSDAPEFAYADGSYLSQEGFYDPFNSFNINGDIPFLVQNYGISLDAYNVTLLVNGTCRIGSTPQTMSFDLDLHTAKTITSTQTISTLTLQSQGAKDYYFLEIDPITTTYPNATIFVNFDLVSDVFCDVDFDKVVRGRSDYKRYLSIPTSITKLTNAYINFSGVNKQESNLHFGKKYLINSTTLEKNIGDNAPNQAFYVIQYFNATENFYADNYTFKYKYDTGTIPTIDIRLCTFDDASDTTCNSVIDTIYDVPVTTSATYTFASANFTRTLFQTGTFYGVIMMLDSNNDGTPDSDGDGVADAIRIELGSANNGLTYCTPSGCTGYTQTDAYLSGENYPSNLSVKLGDDTIYNYSGYFNISNQQTSNIASTIEKYMTASYIVGSNYIIPIILNSQTSGFLQYSGININNDGFTENSQTYNSNAWEGSQQTFSINVSYDSSRYTSAQATLIYNNTRYVSSSSGAGNTRVFSRTISVPKVSGATNKDFYWELRLNGETYNSSSNSQSINDISLAECGTGDLVLNLTLKNEGTNTIVNVTDPAITSTISLDVDILSLGGDLVYEFYDEWSDINNVSICMPSGILNESSYRIDFISGFSSTDSVNEFYHLDNGTLTNGTTLNGLTSKNIDLMALATADSTSFIFNYFDSSGLVVDDIIIHVFRKYIGDGVFREVERSRQNDDGDAVVHLVEEDVVYYFIVTKEGQILYTSQQYTALCQATPCTIQFVDDEGFVDFPDDWDLVDDGAYTIRTIASTRQVNLTFTSESITTYNLTIYKLAGDGSYTYVISGTGTGTAGSILLSVPQISGNVTFFGVIYKDDVFLRSFWIDFRELAEDYIGSVTALFLAGIIILALVLMAVSSGGSSLMVFFILGLVSTAGLGLINFRSSLGLGLLVYLILGGLVIVNKIVRRKT